MTLAEHIKERAILEQLPDVRGYNWIAEKLDELGVDFFGDGEDTLVIKIKEG